MSLCKEQVILQYFESCKKRPKAKNPPTYRFFQKILQDEKICEKKDVYQTSSGLGVYCKLGKGKPINIGRRYGFVVKGTARLRKMFALPDCQIIIFISDEKTSTSNVRTKNIFVCIPWVEQGAAKVSKCKVFSFISLPHADIVTDPGRVISKCLEFKKQPKARKSRKNKLPSLDSQSSSLSSDCTPPLDKENVVVKKEVFSFDSLICSDGFSNPEDFNEDGDQNYDSSLINQGMDNEQMDVVVSGQIKTELFEDKDSFFHLNGPVSTFFTGYGDYNYFN